MPKRQLYIFDWQDLICTPFTCIACKKTVHYERCRVLVIRQNDLTKLTYEDWSFFVLMTTRAREYTFEQTLLTSYLYYPRRVELPQFARHGSAIHVVGNGLMCPACWFDNARAVDIKMKLGYIPDPQPSEGMMK